MIQLNYKHPQIRSIQSNASLELDIWIESIFLAFEYQGEQHYYKAYLFGNLEIKNKEMMKRN